MKTIPLLFSTITALVFSSLLISAPMIPIGPMNIEGTIEDVTWQPKQFTKGVTVNINGEEVPMSGTLGIDRTSRAQYQVTLIDTLVKKPSGIADDPYYQSFPSGDPVAVTIYHDQDDGYLKKGMRIKIYGYQVDGDEGGIWSSYKKVKILKNN